MVDPVTTQRWSYRLFFVALASALLFLRLLPLSTLPATLPGPDLLLCLGFAWVQRRPDILGPLLFGTLLFVADILLGRPPGLWAALGVLGAEFLRSRNAGSGEMPFAFEMGLVAGAIVAIALLYWVILGLIVAPQPSLPKLLIQALFTLLAYPLLAGLATLGFRLSPLTPAEAEAKGATR